MPSISSERRPREAVRRLGRLRGRRQQRDFVHVDDAVSVNLWLLENRGISGIYNCGTGRAQTSTRSPQGDQCD